MRLFAATNREVSRAAVVSMMVLTLGALWSAIDDLALGLSAPLAEFGRLGVHITASAMLFYASMRLAACFPENEGFRFAWRAVGVYAAFWTLGSLWNYLERLMPMPGWPAVGELVLVASQLCLVVGLGFQASSAPGRARYRALFDSLVTTGGLAMISWAVLLAPPWNLVLPPLEKLSLIGRPLADLLIVFVLAMLGFTGLPQKVQRNAVVLTMVAGMVMVLGSSGVSWVELQSDGSDAKWRACLALGQILLAVATYFWSPVEGIAEAEWDPIFQAKTKVGATLRLTTPYVLGMASFTAVTVAEVVSYDHVKTSTFLIGIVLITLIVMRQVTVLLDNQRLGRDLYQFNQNLESNIERRTSQIQSLYSLSKAVGNSLDVEEVVDSAINHARQALSADSAILNLTPFAFTGYPRLGALVKHSGDEQHTWVLDQLNILETPWASRSGILRDRDFSRTLRYAIAPIFSKGKAMGWIAVFRTENLYDPTDRFLLEGLGTEIGNALENARLYEIARQMADIDPVTGLLNHRAAQERFDFAFQHAQDTNEPLSVLMIDINNFKHFNDTYGHLAGDQVLKTVARVLREVVRPHDIPARYGGDEFVVLLPNTSAAQAEAVADQLHGRVAAEGFAEPGTDRIIPLQLSVGASTYPDGAKTRHELIYLADHSMFKAKRQKSAASGGKRHLRKPSATNGDSFDLLDSMVNAVDNKDYYTRAHSEEVADFALWIGQELGLSEETLRTIRMAAILHDVGKIGIPDEILRKPGHLSDEEFEVMKQHPVVGHMIVSAIPGMAAVLPGVRWHHERWDGGGYPDGLAGEAIPLLGRLLAVPDAFSAMTTDRPYRKGMIWPVALGKIREGRGTQFDPEIVDAFLRAVEKRRGSLPHLSAGEDLPLAA